MTKLSVRDLQIQYESKGKPIKAVDCVSFDLDENESLGIVGESGCGKSTLGLAIIRSPVGGQVVSGDIRMDDKSIMDMPEAEFSRTTRWKKISMVFQGAMNSLDPVFSIKQQFFEILKKHSYKGDFMEATAQAVEAVGLPRAILDRYPHELSGGMKQRVVIAMALVLGPRIVIADEPTTALDVLVQAQVLHLLKKFKKEGLSILLISHDLGIVSEIADRVCIMYAGKIVEFGTLEEIYSNPKHPYTQALLAASPKLDGKANLMPLKGSPPSPSQFPPGCRFYDRCAHAMERCKTEPPITRTATGYVSCWLHEQEK